MAKKKDFANVVEESFQEGYQSEPETPAAFDVNRPKEEPVTEESAPAPEVLSENEQFLRKILAGDEDALQSLWNREDRSTYYLTDLQRACIDVVAHREGIKKNDVITTALNRHFSDEEKAEARELVISRAIKKLEKDIKKEQEGM